MDTFFKWLIFIVCAAAAAVAAWFITKLVFVFGTYILIPSLNFAEIYFKLYGRATAEVVGAVGIVGFGLIVHERLTARMTEAFTSFCNRLTTERNELNAQVDRLAVAKKEAERMEGMAREKHSEVEQEKRELEAQIEELETEIERLKNPDAVAAREEAERRQLGEKAILSDLGQARWITEDVR